MSSVCGRETAANLEFKCGNSALPVATVTQAPSRSDADAPITLQSGLASLASFLHVSTVQTYFNSVCLKPDNSFLLFL